MTGGIERGAAPSPALGICKPAWNVAVVYEDSLVDIADSNANATRF